MKNNKKNIIKILMVILLIFLLIGISIYIINSKTKKSEENNDKPTTDIETNNKNENDAVDEEFVNKYKYEVNEENNIFTFYKYQDGYKKINEYKCEAETCIAYIAQCFAISDMENGKLSILDDNQLVIYDFEKGVLGKFGNTAYTLGKYYYVSNIETKKYGIIDINGNIIKDFTQEKLDKIRSCDLLDNTYSIKYDLLVEKKNNKYGIIRITKDDVVVEHKYDDIRIYNDKYYKAKLEDKWYLYSYETKEKVHEQGYKEIFFATDDVLVVQIDKNLYIKNYNGNNLIEDKIETYIDYNEKACCATPEGITVKYNEENNKIEIFVSTQPDEENNYKIYNYEYGIETKKLTKVE